MLQRNGCGLVGANHQYLAGPKLFQLLLEPFDSGVLLNPQCFGVQQFGVQESGVVVIELGRIQAVVLVVALGEARDAASCIAVQNSTGAIPIKHLLNLHFDRRRGVDTRWQRNRLSLLKLLDHMSPLDKLGVLRLECVEVAKAGGVNQL